LQVATLTVANGADNISIYTPLFAASLGWRIAVTLVVFYILLVVWCVLSYALVSVPWLAEAITTRGSYVVPGLLMGLGVYILWSNDCFDLFQGKVHW
jgi:cadmium resistance protein CadD (predicted permease)